jgi:50S ribosomal subunit-associated GTPase HflX
VQNADVLIHVCDRSNPVWMKQREVVLKELANIGCVGTPIVELWNKIDSLPDSEEVMLEAATMPIDVDLVLERDYDTEADLDIHPIVATNVDMVVVDIETTEELDEELVLSRNVDDVETSSPSRERKRNLSSGSSGNRKIFTVAASALTG